MTMMVIPGRSAVTQHPMYVVHTCASVHQAVETGTL